MASEKREVSLNGLDLIAIILFCLALGTCESSSTNKRIEAQLKRIADAVAVESKEASNDK